MWYNSNGNERMEELQPNPNYKPKPKPEQETQEEANDRERARLEAERRRWYGGDYGINDDVEMIRRGPQRRGR